MRRTDTATLPVERPRAARFIAWLTCALVASSSAMLACAHAQQAQPPHYVALVSAGVPLRLTEHEDLGQSRLGPPFADGLFGYVLPGPASYRHGFGLGVSMSLARDGNYVQPIYAGEQLVLMPAYLGYLELSRDLPVLLHAGLPLLLTEGRSFGLELGAALGYRLLAGLGVFAELDLGSFIGARSTLNLLASLELGVIIDYEVLP